MRKNFPDSFPRQRLPLTYQQKPLKTKIIVQNHCTIKHNAEPAEDIFRHVNNDSENK